MKVSIFGSLWGVARCQWGLGSPEDLAGTKGSTARWQVGAACWLEDLAIHLVSPEGCSSNFVAQQLAPLKGEIQDTSIRSYAVTSALFYWDTDQP